MTPSKPSPPPRVNAARAPIANTACAHRLHRRTSSSDTLLSKLPAGHADVSAFAAQVDDVQRRALAERADLCQRGCAGSPVYFDEDGTPIDPQPPVTDPLQAPYGE